MHWPPAQLMSFRTLELPGMQVESLRLRESRFVLSFVEGQVIKTMEGAKQRTRWRQSGAIIIEHAQCENLDQCGEAKVVAGGHVVDNVYVYQDMIRLPLHSFGHIELTLTFEDHRTPLIVRGDEIQVSLSATPRYVEHLDE